MKRLLFITFWLITLDSFSQTPIRITSADIPKSYAQSSNFLNFNGSLYFGTAYNFLNLVDSPYCALWKSDGTTTGTVLIKNVPPSKFYTAFSATQFMFASNDPDGTGFLDANTLWVSDGTTAGTQIIKKFNSTQTYIVSLTMVNGKMLIYLRNNATYELWVSDGTTLGTTFLKSFNYVFQINFPAKVFNNKLYFQAKDNTNGKELWVSDGTVTGTQLLKDINAGTSDSNPEDFCIFNNKLYFAATDASYGRELWVTDGTTANTTLVKDLAIGYQDAYPSNLIVYNNKIYFSAQDISGDYEMYVSDGTAANTTIFKNIESSASSYPAGYFVFNSTLFFAAKTVNEGSELWKSDGTVSGTVLVKDINPGNKDGVPYFSIFYPMQTKNIFKAGNGKLYFVGKTENEGEELWKTDGTNAGTSIIAELNIGTNSGVYNFLNGEFFNNLFYYIGTDRVGYLEPYYTDGTTINRLKSFNPASAATDGLISQKLYSNFITDYRIGESINVATTGLNKIFYAGLTSSGGIEPWVTDGTSEGTTLLRDIYVGKGNSDPNNFVEMGGSIYFAASSSSAHRSLYKTDGTAANTVKIDNFSTLAPKNLIVYHNQLYFIGNSEAGVGLFRSDGTPAGTTLFHNSNTLIEEQPIVYNDELYFVKNGGELWKTDGINTILVKAINSSYSSEKTRKIYGFKIFNNKLFFGANTSTHGFELWKSDGTTSGTIELADINPSGDSYPYGFTEMNGWLYFGATDGSIQAGFFGAFTLFRTDGSTVQKVKQINPTNDSFCFNFTVFNNRIYFFASEGTNGFELWQSDGTSARTTLVQDIYAGPGSSDPFGMTVFNNQLYFFAADAVNGYEPRVMDINHNISLLKDIQPGTFGSLSFPFMKLNNELYFWATNDTYGTSLWKLDNNLIQTVVSGNWNVNSTWDCNCVPTSTNSAQINNSHSVNVPNTGNQVKTIQMSGGNINLNGGTIQISNQ